MVAEAHYTIDKNMKLLIEIDNSEPLQLSTFCQSMEGIAAEYRQFIQDNKIDIEPCEQHIYVEQITTISKLHSQRHILIGVVVIIIAIIVIVAMYTNNTDFALEMLKIGGALLAGYWAGFGRGKASILEKQQDEE